MFRNRRTRGPKLAIVMLVTAVIGCRTVPQSEYDELGAELTTARARLERAEQQIDQRDVRIGALESEVDRMRDSLNRRAADAESLESDLDLALGQLGTLREDRLDLHDELDRLERELQRLRSAASILTDQPPTAARVASRSEPPATDPSAFSRIRRIGFQNDPRAAQRFSAAAPGIGVDTESDEPILYDSRLDYEQTVAYLTIVDPDGRRPRLNLTVQHVTDAGPIHLRTAFITIEGGDPIDPIDPIVVTGDPARETDGEILREALETTADRTVVERLIKMISSSRFLVTFVGASGRVTHRPSVTERAAMSNMLFAFIDLGGLR